MCITSIWLPLSCILYNKPVNVSSVFLNSTSHSNKLVNLRGGHGNPQVQSQYAEVWLARTPHLQLASDVGSVLWTEPFNLWDLSYVHFTYEKLRNREDKKIVPSHTAQKWWSFDLNPGRLASKPW